MSLPVHAANPQLDDEFDELADPFADSVDIDWAQVLATPSTTQSIIATQTRASSPEYFSNSDPLDDAFLAQLDVLDGTQIASSSSLVAPAISSTVPQSTLPSSNGPHPTRLQLSHLFASPQRVVTKRPRTVSQGIFTPSRKNNGPGSPRSGSRKKRRKGADVPHVLASFEGELSCPICFDIFVATHLFNPCGHSFCGDCSWQWITTKRNAGCPVCRTPFNMPMVKNICIDKMVDMHIQILSHADEDWRTNGRKLAEFQVRQKRWKDGVAERNKAVVTKPPALLVPYNLLVLSDDSNEDLSDDSDEDSDDSEDEYNSEETN